LLPYALLDVLSQRLGLHCGRSFRLCLWLSSKYSEQFGKSCERFRMQLALLESALNNQSSESMMTMMEPMMTMMEPKMTMMELMMTMMGQMMTTNHRQVQLMVHLMR
jgi:CII-binding regulator of phage lambda lysogenization HflD